MKYADLKKSTDEDLIKLHDAENTSIGKAYYLDELRHREMVRAIREISGVIKHAASISLSADVVANYFLARWKVESYGRGIIQKPPAEYLHDDRIKVSEK